MIVRNPCSIPGAGEEHPEERPVATVPQVYALADALPDRYRLLPLLAAFASLRAGELFGLRRRHIDPLHDTVRIREQRQQLQSGAHITTKPKQSSHRTVTLSAPVMAELADHLERHVAPELDAHVFTGLKGQPLSVQTFGRTWRRARGAVAQEDATLPENLHFHDLRHTGNNWAAATGASTKELMARMGHRSSRAALLYQHATRDRDAAIARALGELIERTKLAPVVLIGTAEDRH